MAEVESCQVNEVNEVNEVRVNTIFLTRRIVGHRRVRTTGLRAVGLRSR